MKEALSPELFKGTPLEDVLGIFGSGNFAAAPSQKAEEGETVIGDMTDLEKAFWSAADKAEGEFRAIATEHNAWLDELLMKKEQPDENVVNKNLKATGTKKRNEELLRKLLWASIRQRLESLINEGDVVAIREGYKIVTVSNECSGCAGILCISGGMDGLSLMDILSGRM